MQVVYGQDMREDPVAVVESSLRKPMLLGPIGKADPVCTVHLKTGTANISSSSKAQTHMDGRVSHTWQSTSGLQQLEGQHLYCT